jgi:hypothetical protein
VHHSNLEAVTYISQVFIPAASRWCSSPAESPGRLAQPGSAWTISAAAKVPPHNGSGSAPANIARHGAANSQSEQCAAGSDRRRVAESCRAPRRRVHPAPTISRGCDGCGCAAEPPRSVCYDSFAATPSAPRRLACAAGSTVRRHCPRAGPPAAHRGVAAGRSSGLSDAHLVVDRCRRSACRCSPAPMPSTLRSLPSSRSSACGPASPSTIWWRTTQYSSAASTASRSTLQS